MPQETCFRHTRRPADYRCQQCGKPICDRCTVNARFCSRGCNASYSKFVANYQGPVRSGGIGFGSVLLVLLLTGAAAGALWWAKQQGLF